MKLSYEDKLAIYELRKQGVSWSRINQRYDVHIFNLKHMVKLMDRYGVTVVQKGKNRYYPPELKQEIIDKILIDGQSQKQTSLDYALPSPSMLSNWIAQDKKTGILFLRKQGGDRVKWDVSARKPGKR